MDLYQSMQNLLLKNKSSGVLRTVTPKLQQGNRIIIDAKSYVNLSSNDYLGLASDSSLAREFVEKIRGKYIRLSSSGSPLLTGAHLSYARAEAVIEKLFGKKALFFNSGFSANSGVIAALGTKDNLILADKLAHASMIDGMNAAEAKFLRYAHNDYEHLQSLLEKHHDSYDNIIIVTEAVFSMDGDRSDLKRLVELKKQYHNVYLYVDEAHSFGLFNENGAGLCVQEGVVSDIDFILTTFGKGIGSEGACILCNEIARDYLVNTTRSLIFSTALSPFIFEHTAFMLEYMQQRNDLRERLHRISKSVHGVLEECGFNNVSSSQIIPIITGDNEGAVKAFEYFREHGFYAMPIRHPTVPLGKSRLRLSLNASLSDDEVIELESTIRGAAALCR